MMTRRTLAVGLGAIAFTGLPYTANAQSTDAGAIKDAVEALRQAMLAADKAKLESLTADQLS